MGSKDTATYWTGVYSEESIFEHCQKTGVKKPSLLNMFEKWCRENTKYTVCHREVSENGHEHVHVFITLKRNQRRSYLISRFPWIRVSAVHRLANLEEYCKKDGDKIFEFGTNPIVKTEVSLVTPKERAASRCDMLASAKATESVSAALMLCEQWDLMYTVQNYQKLEYAFKKIFARRIDTRLSRPPIEYAIKDCYSAKNLPRHHPEKLTYWIYGKSGMGKSTFISSLPNVARVSKMQDFENLTFDDKEHVVADDFDFAGMTSSACKEWFDPRKKTICPSVRYTNPAIDYTNKQLWVCSQYAPFEIFGKDDDAIVKTSDKSYAAIIRRLCVIHVTSPMYDVNKRIESADSDEEDD